MLKHALTVIALCVALAAAGEVYWLGPKVSSGGPGVPSAPFESLVEVHNAMDEPVLFNGIEARFRVYLVKSPLEELVREFQARYPKLTFNNLGGNIQMSWPQGRGFEEKVLFSGGSRLGNVTVFAVRLPEKRISPIPVPEGLVIPQGAVVTQSLVMKKSGVSTVVFDLPEGASRLEDLRNEIAAAGYVPVEDNLYMREKPRKEMLQLQAGEDGGVITLTPLK